MKKHLFLFGAAMFVCGAMMLTSCSKDEDIVENTQKAQPVMSSNPYETFGSAVAELENNLQQCDFNELQPLAIALQNNTAKVAKAGGINENIANAFISRLSDLVWSFLRLPSEENPLTLNGTYTNPKETIRLAWALSAFVTRNEDLLALTDDNAATIDVIVNDTTTYTIVLDNYNDAAYYKEFPHLSNNALNEVIIKKNGEEIVTITFDASMGYDFGNREADFYGAGTITYQTHQFVVTAARVGNSDIAINVTYRNNDKEMAHLTTTVTPTGSLLKPNANATFTLNIMDDMAIVTGSATDVSDITKTLVSSMSLVTNGGTKQACDELASTLNAKYSVNVNVGGSDQGIVYVGSELVENTENTYRPTLILQFAMFENEPMTLREVLAQFGINIDEILRKLPFGPVS